MVKSKRSDMRKPISFWGNKTKTFSSNNIFKLKKPAKFLMKGDGKKLINLDNPEITMAYLQGQGQAVSPRITQIQKMRNPNQPSIAKRRSLRITKLQQRRQSGLLYPKQQPIQHVLSKGLETREDLMKRLRKEKVQYKRKVRKTYREPSSSILQLYSSEQPLQIRDTRDQEADILIENIKRERKYGTGPKRLTAEDIFEKTPKERQLTASEILADVSKGDGRSILMVEDLRKNNG